MTDVFSEHDRQTTLQTYIMKRSPHWVRELPYSLFPSADRHKPGAIDGLPAAHMGF